MKSNPLVSIIIPALNAEKYIGECLQSLSDQSYKNFEVIVVDNGSSDDTAKICRAWESGLLPVRLIDLYEKGASRARAAGLRHCKGDIIMFVDSDDKLTSDAVSSVVEGFAGGAEIVCFDLQPFRDDEILDRSYLGLTTFPELDRSSGHECLELIWSGNIGHYMCSYAYASSFKDLLLDLCMSRDGIYEDVYIANRVLSKDVHVSYVNKPVYLYRQSDESLVHNPSVNDLSAGFTNLVDTLSLQSGDKVVNSSFLNTMCNLLFYIDLMASCADGELSNRKALTAKVENRLMAMKAENGLSSFGLKNRIKLVALRLGAWRLMRPLIRRKYGSC